MARKKLPDAPPPDDGAALWQSVAASVRPLKKKPLAAPPSKAASPPPRPMAKPPAPSAAKIAPRPSPKPEPLMVRGGRGAVAGLDQQSADKLRKGLMRIEDRLDLHGRSQLQAHGALLRFLAQCQDAGLRCVLIVTGKGERAGETPAPILAARRGILREMLPKWLNEPPARERILMLSQAQPKDGGEGAFYVLLRRRRD